MTVRLPVIAVLTIGLVLPPVILAMASGRVEQPKIVLQEPIELPPMAELSAVYRRALFAAPMIEGAGTDGPDLVGVIGRIGRDAVAIVRQGDGTTRTLGLGDSVDGWRLEALSADAAAFRRGNRQLRVPVPGSGETGEAGEDQ